MHLAKTDPDFHTRYHHWGFVYGSYFEHRQANSLLQTNKMMKKLNKGLGPAEFDVNEHTLAWQNNYRRQKEA